MERAAGIEPASLAWKASTQLLITSTNSMFSAYRSLDLSAFCRKVILGAGGGNRTRVFCLEGRGLTIYTTPALPLLGMRSRTARQGRTIMTVAAKHASRVTSGRFGRKRSFAAASMNVFFGAEADVALPMIHDRQCFRTA